MVAPAPTDPDRAANLDESAYRTLFARLSELVGTLVLDCGTGLDDPPARAALACADQLVLVCDDEPDTASIVAEAASWLRHAGPPLALGGQQPAARLADRPRRRSSAPPTSRTASPSSPETRAAPGNCTTAGSRGSMPRRAGRPRSGSSRHCSQPTGKDWRSPSDHPSPSRACSAMDDLDPPARSPRPPVGHRAASRRAKDGNTVRGEHQPRLSRLVASYGVRREPSRPQPRAGDRQRARRRAIPRPRQARTRPGRRPRRARAAAARSASSRRRRPGWVNAARPAAYYLLLGEQIVLPLAPQADAWVATTCVTQRTLTPTRRAAKSARKASLAARKRAQRRTRH